MTARFDGSGGGVVSADTLLVGTASDQARHEQIEQPPKVEFGVTRLGRYVLLHKLGQGGMGVVYAAYDAKLDRKIAIKLLRTHGNEVAQRRLVREAQAMAQLSHPNVAQVYEIDEVDGRPFIVVEFVDGVTLKTWLGEQPRTHADIIAVFIAAGRGLAAAHAAGLIHRDFKPDNVMMRRDGRVLVMDFGLVHSDTDAERGVLGRDTDTDLSRDLTKTGALMGTPAYMAPEQLLGRETDARTDQFSFCVALWEALYRQRPFVAMSLSALVDAVTSDSVSLPEHSRVPAWLRDILQRGVASDPDQRWPDMDVLLDALGHDPTRRRRRVLGGVAALVGLLGAVALVVQIMHRRDAELAGSRTALKHQQTELAAKDNELARRGQDMDDADNVQKALRASMQAADHRGLEAMVLAIDAAGGYGPDYLDAPQPVVQALFDVQAMDIVGQVAVLEGLGGVSDVALSPDGSRTATIEYDPSSVKVRIRETVRSWGEGGELLSATEVDAVVVEPAENAGACAIVFPPSGERLRVLTCDDVGRVWDPSGKLLFSPAAARVEDNELWEYWNESIVALPSPLMYVIHSVAISSDGRRVVARDEHGITRLWDSESQAIVELPGQPDDALVVAFDPTGPRVATVGKKGDVEVWGDHGRLLTTRESDGMAWSLAYSPDGSRLAIARQGGEIDLLDGDYALVETLEGHASTPWMVTFSADSMYLASASEDRTARLWTRDGAIAAILSGHGGRVRSVVFSPDGTRVTTASEDATTRIWDITNKISAPHGGQWQTVSAANGNIATYGDFQPTRLWDDSGALSATFDPNTRVKFSPGGTRIATFVEQEPGIQLRESSGELVATLDSRPTKSAWRASFSLDDALVVTKTGDDAMKLWDSSGQPVAALIGVSVFFSNSGAYLGTTAHGSTRIWTSSGELLTTLPEPLRSVEFSPDSSHVAGITSNDQGEDVQVWSIEGHLETSLRGPSRSFRFSPNGELMAVSERGGHLRIWSVTGELVVELSDTQERRVLDCVFSPDGTRLAARIDDDEVRVWSSSGEVIATLGAGPVQQVLFSPDGSMLSTSDIASAHLWTADGDPLATFEGTVVQFLLDGSGVSTWNRRWLMPSQAMRHACEIVAPYPAYRRVADICGPLRQ